MKTKQLLILGGIFVLLAIVILLFENPFRQSDYEKKIETATPLFPTFDKEQVAKIEITATGETTTLLKQDGTWVVATMDNYPADSEGIAEVLSKVAAFKNTQRVSSNPEKQADFEVDSTSGIEATLMDSSDAVLAHLFVGKTTPGFLSSYVRVADSDDVYVAQGYLQSMFNKGARTWKDRTIFDFNKGVVTQLNITSPEESVELRLEADGGWQLHAPVAAPADLAAVDTLLTTFSGLETDDFADPTDDLAEYGLDTPQSTISAVLSDGTTATLHVGTEVDGKRYVKRADTETVFQLFTANVEKLITGSETLKAAEPPPTPSEIEIE